MGTSARRRHNQVAKGNQHGKGMRPRRSPDRCDRVCNIAEAGARAAANRFDLSSFALDICNMSKPLFRSLADDAKLTIHETFREIESSSAMNAAMTAGMNTDCACAKNGLQ
jgi:hypothetical protein